MNIHFTLPALGRTFPALGALLTGLLLIASFGAQAKDLVPDWAPVTPEMLDSLNDKDATWPKDPAVPDLPPLADTADPPVPKDNFLASHYYDGIHAPDQVAPARLTAQVTKDNPLKIDVIWSMRSPYSYLVLQRLVWLNSNYNVDLTVRTVMPIAVRSTKGGTGSAGGAFTLWYKMTDSMWDTPRMGQFQGVPFRWAAPDPIWQTLHPLKGKNWQYVHPPEKQPYIGWLVRLAAYAQMQGKGIDYVAKISHQIFGDQSEHWPADVKRLFNEIDGLDYDKAIRYIQKNPEKVDAVWLNNSKVQTQAGHGGVPLMIFQGEPFFGGDRFDEFFNRLRQSGLTQRNEARAPFTTKPLRWPDGM
jgi:2-hydroxychromene-2-carboxylate isomerase